MSGYHQGPLEMPFAGRSAAAEARHFALKKLLRQCGVRYEITTTGLGDERISVLESELIKALPGFISDGAAEPRPEE